MKRYIYLFALSIFVMLGCQKEETSNKPFTIDTEKCSTVGSFVQGSALNNLCKVIIPYTNGDGGLATISSVSTNGMSIPSTSIQLIKVEGQMEVAIIGIPVTLSVTYMPIKVSYNGDSYFTSVAIPVAEDPDPSGTISFNIKKDPIVNLTQSVQLPFTVNPTMSSVVVTSTTIQGLNVSVQSDPNTGIGTVTLTPSASFLGDTLKLAATFGARPVVKVSIPLSYFNSGGGTQLSPFMIKTETELSKLQYGNAKWFQMGNDVASTAWTPLPSFSGYLDGNNKTITYSINTPTVDSVAFVKRVLSGAIIKNLTMKGSVQGHNIVAGLAANSAVVPVNCNASGVNVVGSNILANLVATGTGKDTNVLTFGVIPTSINILAGTQSASVLLTSSPLNVYFNVTNNPTGATIAYDTSSGNITATLPANPNNFITGNVTYVVSLAQTGIGSNVASTPQSIAIISKKMYQSGTGVQSDPYIVTDEDQLTLTTTTYPNAYIKLGNNITMSHNWTPIPTFGGDLNGAGYSVSGITISNYTVDATNGNGLVNVNNGTIHDIQLLNVIANPTNKFGTVAGTNNGTIKNVTMTGVITSTSTVDVLGGLVGELKTTSGIVTNCYANVNINAVCGMVGGIVGRSSGGTTITNCTVKGTISINAGKTRIGGILGRSEGSTTDLIKGCWSQVAITGVTGANNIGGVFGANSNNTLKIEECQFTGSVKGDNDIGGIAGTGINVKNCLIDGAILQNLATPTNGSVGGICSTNKNYELYCIVRAATITGTVGATTKSAAGIGSFYQSGTAMGYPGNCVVINTTITAAIANRISGPAQTGASLLNNYASNVIIQTSPTTQLVPIPDANGQDGANAPLTMDQTWYASIGYDFTNVWVWNQLYNQPSLRVVGCAGIPTP